MIKSYRGLRFYFAILIFVNHLNFISATTGGKNIFEGVFHNGGFAVTFFFILSGFCMSLGYRDKFDVLTKKKYLEFEMHRIKKIYPIYFLSMLWALIYSAFINGLTLKDILKFILGITMTQTLTIKYSQIYNAAGWFISSIFILYLITPFIFRALNKIKDKPHALICIGSFSYVIYVCLLFGIYYLSGKGYIGDEQATLLLYTSPYVRVLHYLAGIIFGMLFMLLKNEKMSYNKSTLTEIISLFLCVAAYAWGITYYKGSQFANIVYIPVIILLITIFGNDRGKLSGFFGNKVNQKLGSYSMYIYLIHYVVINCGGSGLLLKVFAVSNLTLLLDVLLIFTVTFLLSVLSLKIIKKFNDLRINTK